MCAVLVVVVNILREPAFQVAFVNCDDVIQEITPATPYPTLCDSILPRTFERSADRIRSSEAVLRREPGSSDDERVSCRETPHLSQMTPREAQLIRRGRGSPDAYRGPVAGGWLC